MDTNARPPLRVLITVDTEVWPQRADWRAERLAGDIQRDIYGVTEDGEFGLAFQCAMLQQYGLKGVFFVEAVFASAVGTDPLRSMLGTIYKHEGQGVELHAHPEWLKYLNLEDLPGSATLQHFHQLTLAQQAALLRLACDNMRAAGVPRINAFRAGNYGANLDTCRALADVGIPFDFSYNAAFSDWCKFDLPKPLFQPAELCGVTEYPTSYFEDYPGHLRPAQLCACSFREMQHALLQAWHSGWSYFVILSHSFELLQGRTSPGKCRVNRTALARMESLCRFLAQNNDRFQTITCESLDAMSPQHSPLGMALRGTWTNTIARYCEQAWVRLS